MLIIFSIYHIIINWELSSHLWDRYVRLLSFLFPDEFERNAAISVTIKSGSTVQCVALYCPAVCLMSTEWFGDRSVCGLFQAYTSQFIALVMFALMMSEDRISMRKRRMDIIKALHELPGMCSC